MPSSLSESVVEVEAPVAVPPVPSSHDLVTSSSRPSHTKGRLLHWVSAWQHKEAFVEVQAACAEEDLHYVQSHHAEAVGELVSFQMGCKASCSDGGKDGGKGKEHVHN